MVVPDPWRRAVWGAEPRLKRIARALRAGHLEWIPTILRTHGYRTLVQSVRRFSGQSAQPDVEDIPQTAGQPDRTKLIPGKIYRTPDGRKGRWTGTGFEPID